MKIKSSEITPENIYKNRRKFLKNVGFITGTALLSQNTIITMSLAQVKIIQLNVLKILLLIHGASQLMEK